MRDIEARLTLDELQGSTIRRQAHAQQGPGVERDTRAVLQHDHTPLAESGPVDLGLPNRPLNAQDKQEPGSNDARPDSRPAHTDTATGAFAGPGQRIAPQRDQLGRSGLFADVAPGRLHLFPCLAVQG